MMNFATLWLQNEAEGVSIATRTWLAGKKSIMFMENARLHVALEPLERLGLTHRIPILMVMCYTGDMVRGIGGEYLMGRLGNRS